VAAAEAQAFTVTANFTGQQEWIQTVTGKTVVRCHFHYGGQEFTKLFEYGTMCPISIQIE
jgi:hypothetical protein